MKIKMMATIGLMALNQQVFGSDSVFDCQNKVIATQTPSAEWSSLEKVLPLHLAYVGQHLKNGQMQFAGPIIKKNGEPTGGVVIYNTADVNAATIIATNDPLVLNKVVKVSLKAWSQCTIK